MSESDETRSKPRWKFRGRSGSGWLNLLFFFAVFYFVTFTFLVMSLVLFLQSLNSQYPYVTFSHGGTIGPGVSKLPRPRNANEVTRYETMTYNPKSEESSAIYREHLQRCLPLKDEKPLKKFKGLKCSLKKIEQDINSTNWFNWRECKEETYKDCDPCSQCDNFGYSDDEPCFAIGANRVLNWRPKPFEVADLPSDMPDYLKKMYSPECMYVTCDGDFQEPKHKGDNIKNIDEITYIPNNCIRVDVFNDFFNQTCRAKSVRVRFKIRPNVPVTMRCRLWAKNVEYDYRYRIGTTTFAIQMNGGETLG